MLAHRSTARGREPGQNRTMAAGAARASHPWRRPAGELALASAVAAVVSVLVTWPLAAHLGRSALDPYDPRFQAWTIDWVQHALLHPARLFDADIFTPARGSLAFSDPLIGIAVPLLPLRWAGLTPIGVFNAAILLGTALSAGAAYAFGKVVTGSAVAASVVAAAFAFGDFSTLESAHVQTVFRPGVAGAAALAWALADRAEDASRPLWPLAAGIAAVVAWQCSVSFYTGAYALAAALVVIAVRAPALGRRGMLAAGGGTVAAAAIVALLAVPYLQHAADLPGFHWTVRQLGPEGADFLHADPHLLVWGSVIGARQAYPASRPALWPGMTLLVFGATGLVVARRRPVRRRAAAAGVALLLCGAAAAIGVSAAGWRRWAPYRLVYDLVPGAHALRATYRAWMVGLLGLGLLAGLGADAAVRAVRGHRHAVAAPLLAACVVACVVFEGYRHGLRLDPVGVHPVDVRLATAPPGGVLYLPVSVAREPLPYLSLLRQTDFVYRSTAHHHPIPNGYAAFFPPSYFAMGNEVRSLPSPSALAFLRSIGVRYVVVPADMPDGSWGRLARPAAAAPLRLLSRDGGDLLYAVPPGP